MIKIDRPVVIIFGLFLLTLFGAFIGFALGSRILLPILTCWHAYILMIYLLKSERRREAVIYMLIWALMLGVIMTLICFYYPERGGEVIIKGLSYAEEMFRWIITGEGVEGSPAQFIPEHIMHLTVLAALSLLTMSSLSILFGTVLMNYMAYYVARLMLATDNPIITFLVGWHFWSLFRIAGFVMLGVVLAEFLAHGIFKYRWKVSDIKSYLIAAAVLLLADIICKAIFAPAVGELLKSMMGI